MMAQRPRLRPNTSYPGDDDQGYPSFQTPLETHVPAQQNAQQFSPSQSLSDINQQQTFADQRPRNISNEKGQQLLQESAGSSYPSCPPLEQHPACYAPFADGIDQQPVQVPQCSHAPGPASPAPASPGPIPVKMSPEVSYQASNSRGITVEPDANPLDEGHRSPIFPRLAAVNTSRTVAGDDGILANHQPGQIAHPNQVIKGGTWSHSLCDFSDIGTCCLGILCPCILYGKTQYRLSMKSKKQDPTNLLGYGPCNGSCTAMALLCGCQWLLATIQRVRTRKTYDIEGDIASDCVRATCCTCCTLIQDEKEIKKREENRRKVARHTRSVLVSPYMAPGQMAYAPPPT